MAPDRTLDRERWEAAALDAFEAGGLRAVAVEPLARALGVTKGSFYWHFKDRRARAGGVGPRPEGRHGAPPAGAAGRPDGTPLRHLGPPWPCSGQPPTPFIR